MRRAPLAPSPTPRGDAGLSLPQLAHELNSRLDGALRFVRLARGSLPGTGPRSREPLGACLAGAEQALRDMADLLERAMASGLEPAVLDSGEPLGRRLPRLVELVQPLARELGVLVEQRVTAEAAGVRAAVAETILLNGLRNAVRAAGAGDRTDRRVEVALERRDGALRIRILDSGPGPEPGAAAGHGLGLELCRRLVAEAGGRLELRPGPGGTGALLEARVPIEPSRGGPK